METIWRTLPKPIFCLAPMDDVTDTVFRQIVARTGAPDLYFTEFVYVDGLMTRARAKLQRRFVQTPVEQPLIAQIWGTRPEYFYTVARQLADGQYGGFAGIDLNMGCPERKIVRRGCCAGLIDHPQRAVEIIQATRAGAGQLPVSVKTRCGTTRWVTEEWAGLLLRQDLAALTIHGRIAQERSLFPARWEEIGRVVALRDALAKSTLIIGNGDVTSHADGLDKVARYGVDGVMVGRGIFKNLWLFDPTRDPTVVGLAERLILLREHIELWRATWPEPRNFEGLKKFYSAYFAGRPEAEPLRQTLLQQPTIEATLACLQAALMDAREGQRVG